jgi:hypothetical protein
MTKQASEINEKKAVRAVQDALETTKIIGDELKTGDRGVS